MSHSIPVINKIAQYRGPIELGWYDFITTFRRSRLGPLWATIQLALWIATLSVLFYNSFGSSFGEYALYVGIGFFVWDYISWSFQEGTTNLTSNANLLKNVRIDLSSVALRKVSYLSARSLFQLPVPLFLLVLFGQGYVGWPLVVLIPATILLAITIYSFVTISSFIGVFFRDFEFLMPTMTRFIFFVTPVFWKGDTGVRKTISTYNPFSYFLELIRAPLRGEWPETMAWIVVLCVTIPSFLIAIWVLANLRNSVIHRL